MGRFRQVAVILSAIAVVGLAFYILRPRQPGYQGKTLEQWLNSSNPIPREAIQAMGTNSIPILINTIKARPSFLSRWQWLHWGLAKVGWRDRSRVKLSQMKSRATEAFGVLGTNAVSAMGNMVSLLEGPHDDIAVIAAFCLAGMGEAGIARLVQSFGHARPSVRRAAAYACYYASLRPEMIHPPGALAKLATPHLLHCVTNDSVPAAVMSLRALAELNREITWVIPSLTGILQHPNVTTNPMVMQYALNTIGYFGRRAGENSNLVIPFLTNPNPTIAREATNALRALSERP